MQVRAGWAVRPTGRVGQDRTGPCPTPTTLPPQAVPSAGVWRAAVATRPQCASFKVSLLPPPPRHAAPYFHFSKDVYHAVAKACTTSAADPAKVVSRMWQELPVELQQRYKDLSAREWASMQPAEQVCSSSRMWGRSCLSRPRPPLRACDTDASGLSFPCTVECRREVGLCGERQEWLKPPPTREQRAQTWSRTAGAEQQRVMTRHVALWRCASWHAE